MSGHYLLVPNHIYVWKWHITHCLIYFRFIKWRIDKIRLCFAVVLKKNKKKTNKETNKKHHRFSIFIYFARMNFIVDPFAKIDNLSKMCNLGNSCKNPKENWQIFPIRQVKSTQKFPHALKAFPNFSFVCFHWKITWHLGKVNKKLILRERERVSNCIDAQSSCLGSRILASPHVDSLKWQINYCCRICTILCKILKKRLFIEMLRRSLFTKYSHCVCIYYLSL